MAPNVIATSGSTGAMSDAATAGIGNSAVICSILRDDGEMARTPDMPHPVERHGLAVTDIVAFLYRMGDATAQPVQD